MIFVDSSALVAILTKEPDARLYRDALERAGGGITSPVVRLETSMVVARKADVPLEIVTQAFDDVLETASVQIVPITDEVGRAAVEAFTRYGKGRGSKAQLDLADCLSYAVAATHRVPILFKGDDFAQTDLPSALAS